MNVNNPDWRRLFRDVRFRRALSMGIDRHDRPRRDWAYRRNLEFFGAPHAVFIFMPGAFEEREAVDLGIYTQTLMLAMVSRGGSNCAQGALSLYPSIIREHLGVSVDNRLLLGISFGYEDPAHPANGFRTDRAALDEIMDALMDRLSCTSYLVVKVGDRSSRAFRSTQAFTVSLPS